MTVEAAGLKQSEESLFLLTCKKSMETQVSEVEWQPKLLCRNVSVKREFLDMF